MTNGRTGGELIRDFVDTYEIPYVFGNPGTTETTFLAALEEASTTYVLSLHESSAVGIAAGFALITGRPSVVSLHTYPGLANGMFNMRNAFEAGIPLLVINGTQDSRFLVHNPVLGGPNTELAATATKYAHELTSVDELTVVLQRCYLQAALQPPAPVFLSIPMNFVQSRTRHVTFKRTRVLDDAVVSSIGELSTALTAVPSGKLAIVADYAVGADNAIGALGRLATALDADIYAAPFHVQGVVDPLHPRYRGQLPPTTAEINDTLSRYDTMLLVGEKVDTFTYSGKQALPPDLRVIQIAPAARQLGFDWPVDLAVVGDVRATLEGIVANLGLGNGAPAAVERASAARALDAKYPDSGPHASDALILGVLKRLDPSTHVITEGSSEDPLVQEMAVGLGFRNVHFSPRGGGLGWAMPLGAGISLATGEHSVCFVGDGGSMFSIHSIWTAAKHEIPIAFVCFVNREYRILKELWCNEMGTRIADTHFIGLDFKDPDVDLMGIARALGARTEAIEAAGDIDRVMEAALGHRGPSFILINRER